MAALKPIRTEADHEAALARINALMGAAPGTPESDELAVLADLAEAYERTQFPIVLPSPVEAIRFRMEQQSLEPRDLAPYIGSRGRVSEILSGKRPLSLDMIRALHKHLGIPVEVLVQDQHPANEPEPDDCLQLDWKKFPLAEMAAKGWFCTTAQGKTCAEELVSELVSAAGGFAAVPRSLCRRADPIRQNAKTDIHALFSWTLKVLALARSERLPAKYRSGTVTQDFLARLAKLSVFEDGPRRAKKVMNAHGIHLIFVPHLRRTHLDGAALRVAETGAPVVGVTLRHDRADHFWFCLMHELAHVGRHQRGNNEAFVDDLSLRDVPSRNEDPREHEADEWAEEALIPSDAWQSARLIDRPSYTRIAEFAQQIGVHPAIVAGRVRYETKNYRRFGPLTGVGEIRKQLATSG